MNPGKRIVINKNKKSQMLMSSIRSPLLSPREMSIEFKRSSDTMKEHELRRQLSVYKEKNDQSLIKVRFLFDKLQSFGGISGIPQNITSEVSAIDSKIKGLQQLLYFKKSKQMDKLKYKVIRFMSMIQFEMSKEEMDKLQDQIQIILMLLQVFTEKYKQMLGQKEQIDDIIQALRKDTFSSRQAMEKRLKEVQQENQKLISYLKDMEIQIINARKYSMAQNKSMMKSSSSKVLQQNTKLLQAQYKEVCIKFSNVERQLKQASSQRYTLRRKQQELQSLLSEWKGKYRKAEQQLMKIQNDESRWKRRYSMMEREKDEHIRLLQEQIDLNSSFAEKGRKFSFNPNYSFAKEEREEQFYDM